MKKEILSEDDVHKNFLSDNNVSQKKLMEDSILDKYIICRKEDSIFKENDTFLKEDIMNYQLFFLYINFFLGNSNRQFADRFMNVVN